MSDNEHNTPAPYEPGNDRNANVSRIERFQSLNPGQYWRAKCDLEDRGIHEGWVYLIEKIKDVDNDAHTIVLRAHPDEIAAQSRLERRFLVDEFVANFEHEPDGEAVRQSELARIQGEIDEKQREIVDAQTNPELIDSYVQKRLAEDAEQDENGEQAEDAAGEEIGGALMKNEDAVGAPMSSEMSVSQAFSQGITEQSLADMKSQARRQQRVAEIQAEWVQDRTKEISDKLNQMAPYYKEKAAAAVAATQDVRQGVARIQRGLETLDLYVGDDVGVQTLASGKSAPSNEPLTLTQRKLYVQEELSVWVDVDEEFDINSLESFFHALTEHDNRQQLIDQIFPAPRCVVAIATRRTSKNYGDPVVNWMMNERNRECFLLIRDGENLHLVSSPVESHQKAERLFPTRDEQDRIFQGWDGSEVTFNDLSYTDKLDKHEMHALHYRRLLVLLAGLDHRMKLMGDFYPEEPSLDFMTLDFQNRHFRFIHDDTGGDQTIEADHESLHDWITRMNSYLQPGSRVIAAWPDFMNEDNAPNAFQFDRVADRFVMWFTPVEPTSIEVVRKQHDKMIARIRLSGITYWSGNERDFRTPVDLTHGRSVRSNFLVLDAVSPEDLRFYIHHRRARQHHLRYMEVFKRALAALEAERESEAPIRNVLASKVVERTSVSEEHVKPLIDTAVRLWRCRRRGEMLPDSAETNEGRKVLSELEAIVWVALELEKDDARRQAEDIASELGVTPLRLNVTGTGKAVLYTTPTPDERDDRLEPDCWVKAIQLGSTKKGWRPRKQTVALLTSTCTSELVQAQWQKAPEWCDLSPAFASREQKAECFARAKAGAGVADPFKLDFDGLFERFMQVRTRINAKSKYVKNPSVIVPIGVAVKKDHRDTHHARQLCVVFTEPEEQFCYRAPSQKRRQEVAAALSAIYRRYNDHYHELMHHAEHRPPRLQLALANPRDLGKESVSIVDKSRVDYDPIDWDHDLDLMLREAQIGKIERGRLRHQIEALHIESSLLDDQKRPDTWVSEDCASQRTGCRLVQVIKNGEEIEVMSGRHRMWEDSRLGSANQRIEIRSWKAEPVETDPDHEQETSREIWPRFDGSVQKLLEAGFGMRTPGPGVGLMMDGFVLVDGEGNQFQYQDVLNMEEGTLYLWAKEELGINSGDEE